MRGEPIFRDRTEAGEALARLVIQNLRPAEQRGLIASSLRPAEERGLIPREIHDRKPLVLALPRGGVPVAYQVAAALNAELDVFVVRKIGLPGQEELAIGAVAGGGMRVLNNDLVQELQLSPDLIDQLTAREENELEQRENSYRQGRPAIPICGRTVILVDDGLATGASMKAAYEGVRLQNPNRLVVAVPVAARQTCAEFTNHVDQVICAYTPVPFVAVGVWYEDFSQTSDAEVQELLRKAASFSKATP